MAGYTTITATNIQNGAGEKLAQGSISFVPVDAQGLPFSPMAGGDTPGITTSVPVVMLVVAGAITTLVDGSPARLQDVSLTNPRYFGYAARVMDKSGKQVGSYPSIQPTGSTYSLDTMVPYYGNNVSYVQGLTGQGFTFRGAWTANTAYKPYDVVSQNGNTYVTYTTFTSGSSFDGSNWTLFTSKGADGSTTPNFTSPITAPGITIPTATVGTTASADIPTAIMDNVYGLIDAAVDSAGRVISGTLPDGTAWFPAGVIVPSLSAPTVTATLALTGKTVSVDGGSTDSIISTDTLLNQFGLIHAVVDADGRVVSGIYPDGSMYFPGGVKGSSQVSGDIDSEGFAYYMQQVGGYWQIFRKDDVGNIMQLTSGSYNNTNPKVAANDAFITFTTDRTGSSAVYQMDRTGLVQVPLGTDSTALANLNGIAVTGQSLSVALTTTATTLTQPLDNLMLNGGPRSGSANGIAVNAANLTSFVPLIEVQGSTSGTTDDVNCGETIASTLSNKLAQMSLDRGIRFRMAAAVNGQSGQPYANIKLGTVPFTNGITQVTKIHALATAQSLTHATRAFALIHGESDESNGTSDYYADIWQLRSDMATQHLAATGQGFDVPLFLCQNCSWASYGSTHATGTIAYQQLRAMTEQIGRVFLVTPKYFMSYSDSVHLNTAGQQWLGEYYAKAMFSVLVLKKLWRPIYPRKISRVGNKIFIRFWVPSGNSLVIDTTSVTPPTANPNGLNGFEYFDGSTPPAITAVALTPNTTDSVTITLASAPTATSGNRIRYAYTATVGNNPGPTTGPRGNLRDNDSTPSTTGHANLFNWCCHFDYAC